MKFVIISHAEHFPAEAGYLAYAPYVKEMNIWLKYVEEVEVVAPVVDREPDQIKIPYQHKNLHVNNIPAISLLGVKEVLKTIFALPVIFWKVYKAMQWADHIHLRCPGNIGLIGCIVQVFFPKKKKTVKYAGNWDPQAKQPLSYRFQKWILGNRLLSKNLSVLVYGEWSGQSRNVKAFFTASFPETETKYEVGKDFSGALNCLFVGTLVKGKRPMFAIQLVEKLRVEGVEISLHMYGDGSRKQELVDYIEEKKLQDFISLKGNQPLEVVKQAYKEAHFLVLASKSEGWPKAVAEAMFWGAIPIATEISCVPWMLGNGSRGILITPDLQSSSRKIQKLLPQTKVLEKMSMKAQVWSRNYTTDKFEAEIKKLLLE